MQKPSPDRPILKKGHNCWRIAPAKRAAVLIDGANYYAQLDKVIRGAQKSILIIGWDFDAGVKLLPEQPDYPKLGDLLRSLVEERAAAGSPRPGLERRGSSFVHTRSSAGFTITTSGFKFSVHTALPE
jgi:hypothetical protein